MPVAAYYLEPFELPLPRKLSSRSVVYFPGSTIGNFEPDDATEFLSRLVDLVGEGGGLLIGVDLQKDRHVIEAAYNDSAGVTAKFNKNLLARMNRELGANFDLAHWQHYAVYNAAEGRIEIYLLSEIDQSVRMGDEIFQFHAGEKILTEYSYKHTIGGFSMLARQAGFEFQQVWTDDHRWFGVFYF